LYLSWWQYIAIESTMSLLSALGLKPRAIVNDSRNKQLAQRQLARLEQGAWFDVEQALTKASEEGRWLLLRGIADEKDAVPAASRWVQAQPRCAMAQLLLGACLVVDAWKIRGGAYAEEVDGNAWDAFFRTLKEAEAPLQAAADLDTTLADPYAWLIIAEVGGEGEGDKLKTLFRAATARTSLHWGAHHSYFMATTAKWGGSHEDMFSFVRAVSQHSPKGTVLHCLVAVAYCEYALAAMPAEHAAIRTPQCAAEVRTALYAWLDATPDTLEEKLRALGGGMADLALNHFTVACYLCGAKAEGKLLLAALRREIHTVPWAWIAEGARERSDLGYVHDRVARELAR
jgi:hypothetical protein